MSVCQTKLISEQEIVNYTDLPKNVDSSIFCHHILNAQLKNVKTALGAALYAEILDQVKNDTLTADNLNLLNGFETSTATFPGIKPALANWTIYNAYFNLHNRMDATGIHTRDSEKDAPISNTMLGNRQRQSKGLAEYYTEQLICYLKENTETYPLYCEEDCCTERVNNGYGSSGIVLDDPTEDCCNTEYRNGNYFH